MESRKRIPSQLIWSSLTCICLFIGLISFKHINQKIKPNISHTEDDIHLLRKLRIEANENHEQVSIAKSLQLLAKTFAEISIGSFGSNFTNDEANALRTYLAQNILISPQLKLQNEPPRGYQQAKMDRGNISEEDCLVKKLWELIASERNGFFIEARARNGTNLNSLTTALEKELGWSGLLIEGVPSLIQELQRQRRNSWIAKACLSQNTTEYMEYISFDGGGYSKSIITEKTGLKYPRLPLKLISPTKTELMKKLNGEPNRIIECFPLEYILQAINHNFTTNNNNNAEIIRVNLLILDLDGNEYKILNSIPNSIPINIIVLQHWLVPEGRDAFKGLMYSRKYYLTFESDSHYVFIDKKWLLGTIITD